MDTQVRTPQMVFMHPQRLIVPLFQRPYVWNEENQWEPLWSDVVRVAERVLRQPSEKQSPHFLGAVVLQQVANPSGTMQTRTIIDGQQRLTTLQLLLDALHAELIAADAKTPAARIEALVKNAEPFCSQPEDRFKVWPTNRDRPAFNAVMAAPPPVDYDQLGFSNEKMVQAHHYFCDQAREWLHRDGTEAVPRRALAIEKMVSELLQMVVIDLGADENAQEIFETLNARGAQLTAADLIKNFVFQRLLETGGDVESAYAKHWQEFETAFWETEISVGRMRYSRVSIFLNHWLIAKTGEEVVAREVFSRFKRYALDCGLSMAVLLGEIERAAAVYRRFIESGSKRSGPIDDLGLFGYRTGVLESEVIKPLILCLLDPEQATIPGQQIKKALTAVESWMVRRMLVRATTKNYNQAVAELVAELKGKRELAGDVVETFLRNQTSESRYWPDDNSVLDELRILPAYRRLGRGRLRMVLEAIEDFRRGWSGENQGLGGERVVRAELAIEHIMPVKWEAHWPLTDGSRSEGERTALIHTIGNLTLLTGRLNSKVSNGSWCGANGKRHGLEAHDVLILNRELLKSAGDSWTEAAIRARSDEMAQAATRIWPVPEGHTSGFAREKPKPNHKVDLSDLISAGYLTPGMSLTPRRNQHADKVGTLLPDGRIDIGGKVFSSPSEASNSIAGGNTNGWWFFLVDPASKKSLKAVRLEYLESIAGESDDMDEDGDEDA